MLACTQVEFFFRDIVTLNELIIKSGSSLFRKMQSPYSKLPQLLASTEKDYGLLRNSHCKYVIISQCNFDVFERAIVNWSIFSL